MWIETKIGNSYSYFRSDNMIREGIEDEVIIPIDFIPLSPVSYFPDIDTFILCVTEKCNLRCSYCCYSGAYSEHRSHGSSSMSMDQIPLILDFISRYARKHQITISFYGGESLLALDFIKEFMCKAAKNLQSDIRYEVSTNGVLLSSEIIQWVVDKDIALFLSIDGTKDIHDSQRLFGDGSGSFDKVESAISFIKQNFPSYFSHNLHLMMTVGGLEGLNEIASKWNSHPLLNDISPSRIAFVAPNYTRGVGYLNFDEMKYQVKSLIDAYESHPHWLVMRVFFKNWLRDWTGRPIFKIDKPQKFPTCVPNNRKLYVDANGCIGLCEKVSDEIRFGDITHGIDWDTLNSFITTFSHRIKNRCASCEIARVCGICPNVLHLTERQMDIFCNNQRVTSKLKFYALCELAERNLV